jgi:hypothetical protein
MTHPLVEKIVNEGIQSVNVSMLSPQLRKTLLTEAGTVLMHKGRYEEAAHAFALGDNKEMLREQGHWFLEQNRYGLAAYFLLHVEREERLQELAKDCIAAGEINPAKAIYESLHDDTMLHFLRENFR